MILQDPNFFQAAVNVGEVDTTCRITKMTLWTFEATDEVEEDDSEAEDDSEEDQEMAEMEEDIEEDVETKSLSGESSNDEEETKRVQSNHGKIKRRKV